MPAVTVLYASEVALTVTVPAMPVPLSGTLWNPISFALSAKLRLAVVTPACFGSNVTVAVHVPLAASVAPSQLEAVTLKPALSAPPMYARSIFSGCCPVLVTVQVFVPRGFVWSTASTEPKSYALVSTSTFGCGAAGAVQGAPGPPAIWSPFSKIVASAVVAGFRPSHMPGTRRSARGRRRPG